MDSLSCGIPDRFQKAARLPLTIHATSSSSVTFSAKSRSRFRETTVTLRRNHRSRWREIRRQLLDADHPRNLESFARCFTSALLAECDEDWMTGKIYLNLKD
jgi:hypothetical protein